MKTLFAFKPKKHETFAGGTLYIAYDRESKIKYEIIHRKYDGGYETITFLIVWNPRNPASVEAQETIEKTDKNGNIYWITTDKSFYIFKMKKKDGFVIKSKEVR